MKQGWLSHLSSLVHFTESFIHEIWARHLRQPSHELRGALLRALLELFENYALRAARVKSQTCLAAAIPGLRLLDGFQCLICSAYLTQDRRAIQRHVSKAHQQKPTLHKQKPIWRKCKLQKFFAEKRLVRYFGVPDKARGTVKAPGHANSNSVEAQAPQEEDSFQQLSEDYQQVARDLIEQTSIVYSFGDSRSERVLWLERTDSTDSSFRKIGVVMELTFGRRADMCL